MSAANANPVALPAPLAAEWERIVALGSELGSAIESGDAPRARELAADRHRNVVRFFDAFPAEPAAAELRLSLIRGLIASNERLARCGRVQLAEAANSSASARNAQRAITAYREQDGG